MKIFQVVIFIFVSLSLLGQSKNTRDRGNFANGDRVEMCSEDGTVWVEYSQLDGQFCCYEDQFTTTKLEQCPDWYECQTDCCQFYINTNRNGINNPAFFSNFQWGTVSGNSWSEFVSAFEFQGGTVVIDCPDEVCNVSTFSLCGYTFKGLKLTYEDENGIRQEVTNTCSFEPIETEDFEIKTVCVVDETAVNGIIGYRWDSELNAASFDTDDIFPTPLTHVNGAPDETVTITNNWSLTDLDFPVTGQYIAGVDTDISSQEIYTATICHDEQMKLRDNNGNTGEDIQLYVLDCNKSWVLQATNYTNSRNNRGLGEFACLNAGCHTIAININDYSVYGGFNLQLYNEANGTWGAFPMDQTYTSYPKINEVCIKIDNEGNQLNLDDTTFDGKVFKCDYPCYPLDRTPIPDTEISIINGCFDVDGDPANYINVTQEVIFTGGEQTSTIFYQGYGTDTETEVDINGYVFVDCATGEPINEPVVPVICEQAYLAHAFAPIGENGVNFEIWDVNGITGEPSSTLASDIFVNPVDYSGMPAHDNGVPDGPIFVESDLTHVDRFTDQNQWRYWTYLYLTEPIRLREYHPAAETIDYYVGECGNDPVKVATGVYFNNSLPASFDISLDAGTHYIGGEVFDFSAYSVIRYQYSTDNGATWNTVPADWLYTTKPKLSKCQVQVCTKENGAKVLTDIETCLPLGSEYQLKEPESCSSIAVAPDCETFLYYELVGDEGIRVDEWLDTAVEGAGEVPTLTIFNEFDIVGLPDHPNDPDVVRVNTNFNITTTQVGSSHQSVYEGYVYLPEQGWIRDNDQSAERGVVFIGECCAPLAQKGEEWDTGLPRSWVDPYPVKAGIHKIRVYLHDNSGTNSGFDLEFSTDKVNWSRTDYNYTTEPQWVGRQGNTCDDIQFSDTVRLDKVECSTQDSEAVQCAPQDFYTTIVGTIGTVEQVWEASAVTTSTDAGVSYRASFSGTDSEGYPQHANPTPDSFTSNTVASTTNILNVPATLQDQAQSDFYFVLSQPTELREFVSTSEAVGVWISNCSGGQMTEVLDGTYTNNSPNELGLYEAGIYRARIYHADITSNGSGNIQGFINGSWTTLTPYIDQPYVELSKGWYCDDGNYYNIDKSEIIDIDSEFISCTTSVCEEKQAPSEVTTSTTISEARNVTYGYLDIDNSDVEQSLGLPAGTTGCIKTITDHGAGSVYVTYDGSTPSATNGQTISVQYGNYINVCGLDLSLVRFRGSSTGSDYFVQYEIWN